MIPALLLSLSLQGPSLLQQVLPQPTADNGYVEYLAAADMLRSRQFQDFKAWDASLPTNAAHLSAPEGLNDNASPLARRRYELQTFGKALKLIAAGNGKPTSRGTLAMFVESEAFRDLTNLGVEAAYVAYSRGDWASGTTQLLDVLTFGDNVARECMAGQKLGSSIMNTAFIALDARKAQWSVIDCDRISKRVEKVLSHPFALAVAIKSEQGYATARTVAFLKDGSFPDSNEMDTPLDREMVKQLKAMNSADREQLRQAFLDISTHVFSDQKCKFRKARIRVGPVLRRRT